MNNERDELALAMRQNFSGWMGPSVSYDVADAILAAGYSKRSEELAKYKRGAKTLGEIIEKQCRDVLDVTGLHHLVNEDGDGQWDVVWMRLFEMREELKDLKESTIARERKRGDAWRDRAQEMDSRAQSLEVELQAAKPQHVTTAFALEEAPTGTLILAANGEVWRKYTHKWDNLDETGDLLYPPHHITLPAAVLHVGGTK